MALAQKHSSQIEILIRLVVKPLVKFKSECKQWYSIISDHKFILNHARTNHRLNGLLLKNRIQDFPFSLIPLDKDYQSPKVLPIHILNYPGIEILHSSNGLLCFSHGYNDVFVPHDPTPSALVSYHVCHLTSGHTTKIHVFNVESASDLRAVHIAFDPLKSIHYKVVFIRWSGNNIIKLDIYSSETRGWNTVKEVVDVPNDVGFNNRGVYCNGAIYWHDDFRFAVFYFNLDGEFCLKSISTPQVSEEGLMRMNVEYFGESSGHLHLIATRRPVGTEFTIYEMQRDKSNRFVKYHGDLKFMTIKYRRMIGGRNYRFYVYHPLL